MEKMFTQSIVYLKRKSSREETKFNRFCGECIGNFLLFPNTKDKICIEKIRYGDRLILRSTFSGPFSKIYTWYDKRFHKQRRKREKKSEGKREMRDCSDSIFIFSRNVYGTHTWACADLIYEQDVLAYAGKLHSADESRGTAADIKVLRGTRACELTRPVFLFFLLSLFSIFPIFRFRGDGTSAFRNSVESGDEKRYARKPERQKRQPVETFAPGNR